MWELLQRWAEEVGETPLRALEGLDSGAARAVLSDWLLDRDEPAHARLAGELLAIELADPDGRRTAGRRDGLLTELVAHLPADVAGAVRPWAWRSGLPRAATVDLSGFGAAGPVDPSVLEHPVLGALKTVRTSDPRVVRALSHTVHRWHLLGREALDVLAGHPSTRDATGWVWPLELPAGAGPCAPETPLPLTHLALLGPKQMAPHLLAWLMAPVPLEVLRVEHPASGPLNPVADDVLAAARAHPTLQRLEWIGGAWDRHERRVATRPLVRRAHPTLGPGSVVGDRFRLVRKVTDGSTRRFWRAWDHERGRAVTLALVDTFRSGRISLPGVLAPSERIRGKPSLEVYPVDLQPLGPRPWSSAVVSSLARIRAGSNWRGTLEPAFLEQVFVRADGSLAVVAPPVFVSEGWQSVDIQRRLQPGLGPVPWAGDQTRGPVHPIDEDGFGTGPDLVWVVANGIGGNTSAEGPCARALAAFGSSETPLEDRLVRAHRAARPQVSHEDGVVVALTALQLHREAADAPWSARVLRVGGVEAFLLRAEGARRITITPAPQDAAFWVLGREIQPPDPVIDTVELEAGDRLLLCTEGVTDVLDGAQIAALLTDGPALDDPRLAVSTVLRAAQSRGGQANAAAVVVGPLPV